MPAQTQHETGTPAAGQSDAFSWKWATLILALVSMGLTGILIREHVRVKRQKTPLTSGGMRDTPVYQGQAGHFLNAAGRWLDDFECQLGADTPQTIRTHIRQLKDTYSHLDARLYGASNDPQPSPSELKALERAIRQLHKRYIRYCGPDQTLAPDYRARTAAR